MIRVLVHVSLKPSLLDSAGRAVLQTLHKMGFEEVDDVRVGKTVVLEMEKYHEARVKQMCEKLLANSVIENYRVEVQE